MYVFYQLRFPVFALSGCLSMWLKCLLLLSYLSMNWIWNVIAFLSMSDFYPCRFACKLIQVADDIISLLGWLVENWPKSAILQESSLPDAFPEKSWVSPNATTRSRKNGKAPLEGLGINIDAPSSSSRFENISPEDRGNEGNHPLIALLTSVASNTSPDPFDMGTLSNEMHTDSLQQDVAMEEKPMTVSSEMPSAATDPEGCSGNAGFLVPEEVSVSSIRACFLPFNHSGQRMVLFYEDVILQLCSPHLRVQFGLSTKFADHAGRPRLSFVVNASPSLCRVLEACDDIVQKLFVESGGSSDWRPVLNRKPGFFNYPTVRLQ